MSYWPAVTEHAGLTFCAANVAVRGGELDLIMRDGATGVRRSALPPQRRLRRRGRQRHLSQTTAVAACRRRLAGGARSQF